MLMSNNGITCRRQCSLGRFDYRLSCIVFLSLSFTFVLVFFVLSLRCRCKSTLRIVLRSFFSCNGKQQIIMLKKIVSHAHASDDFFSDYIGPLSLRRPSTTRHILIFVLAMNAKCNNSPFAFAFTLASYDVWSFLVIFTDYICKQTAHTAATTAAHTRQK